jgi:hypothetical protein
MQQLALEKHQALIASVTPIAEKHGDETVLAASIKFHFTAGKAVLDQLGLKNLRVALYRKPGSGQQQSLPMEGEDGHTALAFPSLKAFSIDEDFPGYVAVIGSGLDIGEPLKVSEATVKKIALDPMEGGSVAVSFSLVCHPDARTLGELCELLQDTVDLTLTPPQASAVQEVPAKEPALPKKTRGEQQAAALDGIH